MAAFILTDEQQVAATVAFTDAAGNPTTDDGTPVWAASDSTILTVTAAADGLSATVVAAGPLGNSQLSVTANPADGSGTPVVLTQDITVVASAAVAGTITLGAPSAK